MVLISGIPAVGKTCFGEWLARNRGFLHVDLEKSPLSAELFCLDPPAFISKARAGRSDLVITWGFPPTRVCIAKIRELHAAGLVPWWFDGDRGAALQNFQQRRDHPGTMPDWDRQLLLIEVAWPEIVDLYDHRRIDVIGPGPSFLEPEEIFARMFP